MERRRNSSSSSISRSGRIPSESKIVEEKELGRKKKKRE